MIKYEKLGIVMNPLQDNLGKFLRLNPGVILKNGTVHMLYTATDSEAQSDGSEHHIPSIGYAKLDVNGKVLYDSNKKVIFPTLPEESMGCENPRIVEFEGTLYIFYTAFDGKFERVALAKTKDFENYVKLGVIKHFLWDKDAIILPERVNGKIVYIHKIGTEIQVDYFNSISDLTSEESWFGYENRVKAHTTIKIENDLDGINVLGSVPPIKTKNGWLLLYHGVNKNSEYMAGASLLDLNNPSKVIAQIPYPMLELAEEYEIHGEADNVVFPEGAYISKNELYIYYGAAGKYIALAKINVDDLLEELNKYPL